MNELLITFINDPYNDSNNFNLGFEYEKIGQTAAALSYYLRCSEFTKDTDLAYESLLRMSVCLSKQGNRDNKELTCLEHSISINPNRPEAYYIMSLYHSYRNNYLKSYMYACIGLENLSDKKLIKDIGFFHKYQLLFQKAFSGYNKGKISESKNIYYSLLKEYDIDDFYENLINNNLKQYPEPNHKPIQYKKEEYDKLKYKFNNLEKIDRNYSQIYQDMFVLSMHNGKKDGTYLEIGSGDPMYGNNTYLLEKDFNWKGLSIDINIDSWYSFIEKRENQCLNVNALECDYNNILEKYGNIIDYLQLDCDPPNITYDILLKIPFDKIKFGVITYEHDYYNDKTKSYREKSREYLINKGYKLIVGNISPDRNNNPFEDWWIHPDLIDESIYDNFIYEEVEYINGEDYMFINNKKEELSVNQKIGFNIGAGLGETNYLFDNYDKIYCFEPNNYCFNELKNKFYDNRFKLYNYGISDIDGYSKFNNCQHSGYSSILDFDENSEFYNYCNEIDNGFNNINNITKIKVKRLDTFIEENNIENINLIKIDTQGHDFNVVKSLGNKINIVDTIILECQIKNLYKNSFTKEEIINYMNNKNFKLIKEEPTSEIVADFEENLVFKKSENNMKLTILPEISINKNIPTALIIDNFYNNVDEVRRYALSLNYESEENHGSVGFRCESGRKIYDGTKEYFEHLLNVKIQDDNKVGGWNYSTNGCFQWCPKGTRLVYHCDSQNYAGIVYLTPDAPVNCGTSLLRHKKHKIKDNKIFELDDWHELIENKDNLFTDKTPWEEVDNFGNIYNRLVLFNSYNVHAVNEYFGDNINNSRLFQLFFFNILN